MYAAGREEIRLMDQYTMNDIGLPGVVLMENAGAKVVEEIVSSTPLEKPKVIVLAGPGNNGGDGFVIARRLIDIGWDCMLCLLVSPERITGDAKVHFDVYMNRQLPVFSLEKQTKEELLVHIKKSDMIVDCMLGTGVSGPVRKPFSDIISLVNQFEDRKFILSVDIPSGLNSDTGKAEGIAVKAAKTVTFVFPKKGFFLKDGPLHVGKWKAVDISVPTNITEKLHLTLPVVVTENRVREALPKRPLNGHKGTFGHVLVIGGSKPYVGAPIYTSKSAFLSGAGLVTLAVPESIYPMAAAQLPEVLFLPLPESDGAFSKDAVNVIASRVSVYDAIAVGPGLSRFRGGRHWMEELFRSLDGQPVVVDADALFLSKNILESIREYNGTVIFTPHPGEMAALLNQTVQEVEADRLSVAKSFAKKYGIYVLLKGHRSILASPTGDLLINPIGHDALAKGGSGDVLTGLISSFLAQGANPMDAMAAACYLHAGAGEKEAEVLSHYGVTALDLIEGVRKLLNDLS